MQFFLFLGLEVFYQVAGQIILLIYAKTGSSTAGGLETVKDTLMGLQMDPDLVLGISNALTLISCFTLHMKAIKTAKLYLPWRSSVLIFSYPASLGLFGILYHYKVEQIPFKIWRRYNRTQNDKIVLLGLKAMRSLYYKH